MANQLINRFIFISKVNSEGALNVIAAIHGVLLQSWLRKIQKASKANLRHKLLSTAKIFVSLKIGEQGETADQLLLHLVLSI